ncbi:hypothetical protein [Candidatus Parabeggiatoa sp. HSG14]|uniref:hypothetical protein n=1 Tax=Candidatus Parabeggiatoa sp. HSG14 TaxID=3055593 RepID=UPI0025A7BC69|nr:hypothetical protein [Thiotrichales bacterium HSG14]
MLRTKITLGVAGLIFSGISTFNIANAVVPDAEWKIGIQCLEDAGLSAPKLLCMNLNKKQLKSIMRGGFLIGTKTRQPWCNLVDKLGLRASADDARGNEEMVGCGSDDEYTRAFERGGKVVGCMTEKVFTDYGQWGSLATHMYYCGELGSSGDCVAAVELAKKLRGREPDCKDPSSLWRWAKRLDYRRLSLDKVYENNCGIPAEKMLPYCESVIKDKNRCKSLYGTK